MLKDNYLKLKSHLSRGGLHYMFTRGLKYLGFILKREHEKIVFSRLPEIRLGNTQVVFSDNSINILYGGQQITKDYGLNVAINCSGEWVNAADSGWEILKKTNNKILARVNCRNIGIDQLWTIALEDSDYISWRVDLKVIKPVKIDEICIICSLNQEYKTWINNFTQDNFPDFTAGWKDLFIDNEPTSLLGVRFSAGNNILPPLIMETQSRHLLPLVRNSPANNSQRIIGMRHTSFNAREVCEKGSYPAFSGSLTLFKEAALLDSKIEKLRTSYLNSKLQRVENKKSEHRLSVLLVNLPWQKEDRWGVRAGSRWPHIKDSAEGGYLPFPFFLAYAASLLEKNGINAALMDAIAEQISEERFLELILERNFDYLVAETSVPSFEDDLRLLGKLSYYGISIILCGPNYEIFKPEFLEKHPFIDFVLYGEYEFSLLDFIQARQNNQDLSKVKGLIYKDNGRVVKNPSRGPFDIDLLPWPLRDNLPMVKYLDAPGEMRLPSVQMLASRGCPFKCQFCLWPQVMYQGCHYRYRNVIDVIDEMEYLVKKKGFKSVYFDDDTFNVGRQRMLNICKEINKRQLNKTQWSIMARPDLMDEELLNNFKKAGLYSIKYGVESSSQELVDNIGKDMDLKKAERMILLTRKLGIKAHLTFTFGLPGETRKTIQETVDWVKSLDPFSAQFSIVTPFPGTDYYETLDRQGLIVSKDLSCYDGNSKSVIRLNGLMPKDLEEAKNTACKVWLDHVRTRRGFWGDAKRFVYYCKNRGLGFGFKKVRNYLNFIRRKRKEDLESLRR
jgi:radical SAM superfamily enzyme YgiQ (UPF0313 family)